MAKRGETELLVVAVPYACYVSERSLAAHRRMGFEVSEAMLTSNAPDAAIERAARSADVECVKISAGFRAAAAQNELYFEFDGHFNERGHELFAESLLAAIEPRLR